jgi:hypothetical protein
MLPKKAVQAWKEKDFEAVDWQMMRKMQYIVAAC